MVGRGGRGGSGGGGNKTCRDWKKRVLGKRREISVGGGARRTVEFSANCFLKGHIPKKEKNLRGSDKKQEGKGEESLF